MSMYGPPGGPYPGQPQDPWQGGQPQDPYGQPADPYGQPWGQPEPWGGAPSSVPPPGGPAPYGQPQYGQPQYDPGYAQPTYNQPQYGQPGYPPGGDMWGPPVAPPQPKKGGSGLLITVIVVLAVLLCGGGAAAIYLVSKNKADPVAGGTPTPAASNKQTTPAADPTTPASNPTTPGGNGALNARKGDCLINDGTGDAPKMRKVPCAPGTFEVLKRIDGTSDTSKCADTPGYSHNYYYKSTVDALSFVLCMKLR